MNVLFLGVTTGRVLSDHCSLGMWSAMCEALDKVHCVGSLNVQTSMRSLELAFSLQRSTQSVHELFCFFRVYNSQPFIL